MEKLPIILALAIAVLFGGNINAQGWATAGGTVNPQSEGKLFNTNLWSAHGAFRLDWFNFSLDLQHLAQDNPLYEKAGIYTLGLGYGYRQFALMVNGGYREDYAFDNVNNRFGWNAGVTIDWLQPITVSGRPLFFLQGTARGQKTFGQTAEFEDVVLLPDYQSNLTARFGVKLFRLGNQNVYAYGEYSKANIFLEDGIAEDAGGDYVGIGLKTVFYTDDRCPSGWLPKSAFGVKQDQSRVKRNRGRYNRRRHR